MVRFGGRGLDGDGELLVGKERLWPELFLV